MYREFIDTLEHLEAELLTDEHSYESVNKPLEQDYVYAIYNMTEALKKSLIEYNRMVEESQS